LSTSCSDLISPESWSGSDAHYSASVEECGILADPIYTGSSITVGSALCALMKFCLHNKLIYKAIDELLKLLQILCITPNNSKEIFYSIQL